MFATIFTVKLGKNNEHIHIEKIKELYPNITDCLKRGDIIENIDESGYRTQGCYIFDGTDVIDIYDEDVPRKFHAIMDFPVDYYYTESMIINNDFESVPSHLCAYSNSKSTGKTNMYWHYGENGYLTLFMKDFKILLFSGMGIVFQHDQVNYFLLTCGEYYKVTNDLEMRVCKMYDESYRYKNIDESIKSHIGSDGAYDFIISTMREYNVEDQNLLMCSD